MNYSFSAEQAQFGAGFFIFSLVIALLSILIGWKIYSKAGKPGWAVIIPIYNIVVYLRIIGRPVWWIILAFIPFVNVVVMIIMSVDLAKSFGKGAGFAIGLIFLPIVFYPVLAFGSARYQGPAGS